MRRDLARPIRHDHAPPAHEDVVLPPTAPPTEAAGVDVGARR